MKFTSAGAVTISLTASEGADGKRLVRFDIRDTGIGLSEDSMESLFQPFVQADNSTTRKYGGTGLGLTICKRIVEGMGGEISVTSELDRGSCFTFTLPMVVEQIATGEAQTFDEDQADHAISGLTVLVAEDQPTNRMVINAMLGPKVKTLLFAENGVEAVRAWEAGGVDLILMDIQMPQMDGVEATKVIRTMEAANNIGPVPIIALTANAFSEQGDYYLSNGLTVHLSKPVDFDLLFQTMARCLEPKRNAA